MGGGLDRGGEWSGGGWDNDLGAMEEAGRNDKEDTDWGKEEEEEEEDEGDEEDGGDDEAEEREGEEDDGEEE